MPGIAAGALIGALALVNCATYLQFRSDKLRAIRGRRRIPERRLLMLALVGGSPAALLARHMLRHKTRKQPFSTLLLLIVAGQIGLCALLAR